MKEEIKDPTQEGVQGQEVKNQDDQEVQEALSVIAMKIIKQYYKSNNEKIVTKKVSMIKKILEISFDIKFENDSAKSKFLGILNSLKIEHTVQENQISFNPIYDQKTKEALDEIIASSASKPSSDIKDLVEKLYDIRYSKEASVSPTVDSKRIFDSIACGRDHTAALGNDGKVWTWGCNNDGQLGLGHLNSRNHPNPVIFSEGVKIKKIASGWCHSIALDEQGRVWGWGLNSSGQLGASDQAMKKSPIQISIKDYSGKDIEIADIVCGNCHSFFITKDNKVYATGYNGYGQLGFGDAVTKTKATELDLTYLLNKDQGEKIVSVKISSGLPSSSYLLLTVESKDGVKTTRKYSCGRNDAFQLAQRDVSVRYTFIEIPSIEDDKKESPVIKIVPGYQHTIFIHEDGTASFAGGGPYIKDKFVKNRAKIENIPNGCKVIDAAAGFSHSIFLLEDEDGNKLLYGYGTNSYAELGFGDQKPKLEPVKMQLPEGYSANDIKGFDCGANFTQIGLKDKIFAVGTNTLGQLGINDNNPKALKLTEVNKPQGMNLGSNSAKDNKNPMVKKSDKKDNISDLYNEAMGRLNSVLELIIKSKIDLRYSMVNLSLLNLLVGYNQKEMFKFSDDVKNNLKILEPKVNIVKLENKANGINKDEFNEDENECGRILKISFIRDELSGIVKFLHVYQEFRFIIDDGLARYTRFIKNVIESDDRKSGKKSNDPKKIQKLQTFSLDNKYEDVIQDIADIGNALIIAVDIFRKTLKADIEKFFNIQTQQIRGKPVKVMNHDIIDLLNDKASNVRKFFEKMLEIHGVSIFPADIIGKDQKIYVDKTMFSDNIVGDDRDREALNLEIEQLIKIYTSEAKDLRTDFEKAVSDVLNIGTETMLKFRKELDSRTGMIFDNKNLTFVTINAINKSIKPEVLKHFCLAFCLSAGFNSQDISNSKEKISKFYNALKDFIKLKKSMVVSEFIDNYCVEASMDKALVVSSLNKAGVIVSDFIQKLEHADSSSRSNEKSLVIYL